MDDSSRLRAEFPLGTTATVIVSQPTDGQLLVLALSRQPEAHDEKGSLRLVRRLLSVVEALMGPDTWDRVVEDGLVSGSLSVADLMELIQSIMQFEWKAPEDALQSALDREEAKQNGTLQTEAPRPAPRLL